MLNSYCKSLKKHLLIRWRREIKIFVDTTQIVTYRPIGLFLGTFFVNAAMYTDFYVDLWQD